MECIGLDPCINVLLSLSIMHRLHAQHCFLGTNKSYGAIRSVIKSVVTIKKQTVKADTSISNVNNLYFKYCETKLNIQTF